LAGAGGGFDVFSGLPLYYGLRDQGKDVFLANLSFTNLEQVGGRRVTRALKEVTADSSPPPYVNYFPEGYLCRWFRQIGEEASVYCFARTGVQPLLEGYRALVEELNLDAVVLIDGGTDSLMRGDEEGLGTPHEDMASIAAVDELNVGRKLLVCLGFGVDHYHGVCHAHVLEAVAELMRLGGFLGTFSLLPDMPEVERYRKACAAVFAMMPDHVSIVSSSILSALEGRYGDHHTTDRTAGSTLWINPLLTLYWCFQLGPVARRVLYLDALKQTQTYIDVDDVLEAWRFHCAETRPRVPLPL
jgi:hypothetical protein